MWSYPSLLISGLPWTLSVTAGAFAIGALLGLPVMLAEESTYAPLRLIARAYVNLVRAVPPIVWLFIVYFGVGSELLRLTPFGAALIGLGLISSAHLAEIYRGGMISIGKGQREAAAALNLGPVYSFIDVMAPQAIRVALPPSAGYAIGLLKDSAIASAIGVPELTERANEAAQATLSGLPVYITLAVIYILMSLPIAWLARTVDAQLRAKVARG
jgi:polar amino acid transport system permease protein